MLVAMLVLLKVFGVNIAIKLYPVLWKFTEPKKANPSYTSLDMTMIRENSDRQAREHEYTHSRS